MCDDDAPPGDFRSYLRKNGSDIFIGQAMEAVSLHSCFGQLARQRIVLRELLLGLPGLLYLHFSERSWQRRRDSRLPAVD